MSALVSGWAGEHVGVAQHGRACLPIINFRMSGGAAMSYPVLDSSVHILRLAWTPLGCGLDLPPALDVQPQLVTFSLAG